MAAPRCSAGKEKEMSQRTVRCALIAAALAAALTLAAPAQAAGPAGRSEAPAAWSLAWQWLESLWGGWTGAAGLASAHIAAGMASDPNSGNGGSGASFTPNTMVNGDMGPAIDPNGTPK
jgi:hypothetical protein